MDLTELNAGLTALSEQEFLTLPAVQQWLQRNGDSFRIDAIPDQWADDANMESTNLVLHVNRRDDGRWGVMSRTEQILTDEGKWLDRPVDYSLIDSVRFPLHEAIAHAREAAKPLRHMGMTPQEFIAWIEKHRAE